MITFDLTNSLEHLHRSLEPPLKTSKKSAHPSKYEQNMSIKRICSQEWVIHQLQKIRNTKENNLQFRNTPEYCVRTNIPADRTRNFTQLKKELIDSRIREFTYKSEHVTEWFEQSIPILTVFIKEILHWIPGIDTTVTPIIESGIEQQYNFLNEEINDFYGGIYIEMGHSLNQLLLLVGIPSLRTKYREAFNIYRRVYQQSLEFQQVVDYLHKVHQQRRQLNTYITKVNETKIAVERQLKSSMIDITFCKEIQEKISILVIDDFKQICYPDPPRYEEYIYNVNYESYMYVSSHKLKLIEIDQQLTRLLNNVKNKKGLCE